ncbi:MAG: hypothetical protein IPJ24_14045 [bacterium]|nr:hypothetical protein [bacterium]
MAKKRIVSLVLAGVALAAGLGAAVYLTAGGADKLRPRDVPVRVAFAAPAAAADRPAVSHYEAQVRDITRGDEELVKPLEFTLASGPVDSHVVWLMLDYYHSYLVRVRGVAAGGATGLWSDWSDPHENSSPWETPEPPGD